MTRSKISIRRARESDRAGLLALEAASFRYDLLSPRQMLHHIRNPRARLLVAGTKDNLLGYMLLFIPAKGPARIYSVAVAKRARGRGIAKALLHKALLLARREGCARVSLEVRVGNRIAIRFYKKAGFFKKIDLKAYYEDGSDGMRMVRELKKNQ